MSGARHRVVEQKTKCWQAKFPKIPRHGFLEGAGGRRGGGGRGKVGASTGASVPATPGGKRGALWHGSPCGKGSHSMNTGQALSTGFRLRARLRRTSRASPFGRLPPSRKATADKQGRKKRQLPVRRSPSATSSGPSGARATWLRRPFDRPFGHEHRRVAQGMLLKGNGGCRLATVALSCRLATVA